MSNLVGLKFVLDGASFISAVMTKQEAESIINQWLSGYYQVKDIQRIGSASSPTGGWAWGVEVSAIRAIHTFEFQPSNNVQNRDAVRPY